MLIIWAQAKNSLRSNYHFKISGMYIWKIYIYIYIMFTCMKCHIWFGCWLICPGLYTLNILIFNSLFFWLSLIAFNLDWYYHSHKTQSLSTSFPWLLVPLTLESLFPHGKWFHSCFCLRTKVNEPQRPCLAHELFWTLISDVKLPEDKNKTFSIIINVLENKMTYEGSLFVHWLLW